ncbi:MAG: hypothetical protein JXA93_11650 [Anaerolineae bacterium]|nr:hypothetical protein [Anaerolineae bacterium]
MMQHEVDELGLPYVGQLVDFWALAPPRRDQILLDAIAATHAWHYSRNRSYRQTVEARGVGSVVESRPDLLPRLLPRLLRPTAQTFKSYIDITGSPFPQDNVGAFLEWLADQLSVDLPRARFAAFRPRYRSLEALLTAVEQVFADLGLELSTSSGTSGRSTIMVRDRDSTAKTVDSFHLAFLRYLGVEGVQRALFVMPRQTRIAMARMAAFSVQRLGLGDDHIHFAIPFPADPDRVRIRAGRTFRPGLSGAIERRFWYPFMGWMQARVVDPRAVHTTVDLLARAEAGGERLLLFGGWVQLHAVALALQAAGRTLRLAAGSLLGTGGGLKELYPFTPAQIRADLASVITLQDGGPIPIRDVYGMAEGNWAAMQCCAGNYHVPPWIYARTLDEDDGFQQAPDSIGLLAFFDPFGGGRLFPAFFKTADRVRLIHGNGGSDMAPCCPCGEAGTYIPYETIQRVDLLDEAGCAAQL